MGVRVFAIEDNAVIVERVNRYIQGGGGTQQGAACRECSVYGKMKKFMP
jgi:erythromycin esterase-like protein